MKNKSTLLILLLFFAVSSMVTNTAMAAHWVPVGSHGILPQLNPVGIFVGGSIAYYYGGVVIVVKQGDTVNLTAYSRDKDTKIVYYNDIPVYTGVWEDECDIIWSSNGGGLPTPLRRARGATITFTAPTLGQYETSRTIMITAQADDTTTAAPGTRPAGDTGDRNDSPGGGTYIYFKVIKNCPVYATLGTTCSPTFAWMFANEIVNNQPAKTTGFKTVPVTVSGGTPPIPPNNWNNMFIKETMVLHPTAQSAPDSDFDLPNMRSQFCTASIQGWVVGCSIGAYDGCPRTLANNRFWDDHGMVNIIPVLKDGKDDKTIHCLQKYWCATTQLDTGGANKAIKRSGTFSEDTYNPPGPPSPYRVTKVSYTLATE
ncbi:MAG: hypothetical protein GY845_13295 [Planctomycetes bacterium]|nr:hypothetical protein [Planctomycetota bacterium]